VRRQRRSEADAEDLTQEFFARLLAKDYLRLADPQRGRFRTFLLTSMKHFLVNDWEHGRAARRGGGVDFIPISGNDGEVPIADENACPELVYDKSWAAALIDQTLAALNAEYTAAGKSTLFQRMKPLLGIGAATAPQETIATELGLTAGAFRVAVHRLRDRYRELLRAAVAHTVASPADVDDELRHLINVIRAN
jgi:RNA polymerase sigma-70 factor (ECF subfamily)